MPFSSPTAAAATASPVLAAENDRDRDGAQHQGGGAPEKKRVGADGFDDGGGQTRAGHAAEHHAAADEAEEPLRLPRIVDAVGQRPELADQQNAQDEPPDVERDGDPVASVWKSIQKPTMATAIPACVIGSAHRFGRMLTRRV